MLQGTGIKKYPDVEALVGLGNIIPLPQPDGRILDRLDYALPPELRIRTSIRANRLVQRTTRLEPHLARSMESAKTRLSTASAPRHLTETAAESVTAADVLGWATFKLKWTSF